ncbi:CPBP family intramembrane metalloprotease [Duganella sp. sic0402]|uniref:CPBP family intramembrane glutamic endopeptidase n=1 Tax=Duganella sp. sic0402 TaxID=2854786 RepID=UPI001C4550AD|nr:CPBP family intramembrane glutamic endopeptidase [Duganella sp. sic0402]MBV7539151.1 CPBP family intramembrane metalloprotease [Duganella sp. sic0402]
MIAAIAGLLLAMGLTSLFAFLKRGRPGPIEPRSHLLKAWGGCLAVLAVLLLWEQRTLASIGIVWGNYLAWLIGAALGMTILSTSVISVIQASKGGKAAVPADSEAGLMRLLATPAWFRWAVVITAGVTEEIMFRGYPIERLYELTGSLWIAALVPLTVFTLAHLGGWSWGHLIGVMFGGSLLTGLYLWQRDLVACMIAHVLIDALIIFLPALLRKLAARAVPYAHEQTEAAKPS